MRHITTAAEKRIRPNVVRSFCGQWVRKHHATTRQTIDAGMSHHRLCSGCLRKEIA